MTATLPTGMDALLKQLLQDTNGADVYNNDKAMHGFLEAGKFMVITKEAQVECGRAAEVGKPIEDLGKTEGFISGYEADRADYVMNHPYQADYFRDQLCMYKMLSLNYLQMRANGYDATPAFVIAALRTRWAALGGLTLLLNDMTAAASRPEYVVVSPDPAGNQLQQIADAKDEAKLAQLMGNEMVALMTAMQDADCGIQWVMYHADAIWAASEYVFRVRGHHYKDTIKEEDSYKSMYNRYLEAYYQGEFKWPASLKHIDVFRTAIHPFKMRALPRLTMHMHYHGTIANAAVTRFSGAPVGNALITTSHAGLNAMRSEIWYKSFVAVYAEEIGFVEQATKAIANNKYGYHMSASLYGVTKQNRVRVDGKEYTMDEVKARVAVVAAACQGLIQALSSAVQNNMISKFALSNAKALEKAAADAPTVTLKVKELVEMAISQISNASDVNTAVRLALPSANQLASTTAN